MSRTVLEWLNLASGLALYGIFLAGLFLRRARWLMFAVPTMSMLSVYALLTQNMSRFTVPANPMFLMALFVLVHAGLRRWLPRARTAVDNRTNEASPA